MLLPQGLPKSEKTFDIFNREKVPFYISVQDTAFVF